MPTFFAGIERTISPERESRGGPDMTMAERVVNAWKARSPWHSDELAQRTDVWGKKQLTTTFLHQNWISPIWTHEDKHDPVSDELYRLHAMPSYPQRELFGVKLTDHQYWDYVARRGNGYKMPKRSRYRLPRVGGETAFLDLEGKGLHQALAALMKTSIYRNATDGDPFGTGVQGMKGLMIQELTRQYTRAAAVDFLADHEDMVPAAVEAKRREVTETGRKMRSGVSAEVSPAIADLEAQKFGIKLRTGISRAQRERAQ